MSMTTPCVYVHTAVHQMEIKTTKVRKSVTSQSHIAHLAIASSAVKIFCCYLAHRPETGNRRKLRRQTHMSVATLMLMTVKIKIKTYCRD